MTATPATAAGRRVYRHGLPKHRHSWLDEFSKQCIECGATKTEAAQERWIDLGRITLQDILAIEAEARKAAVTDAWGIINRFEGWSLPRPMVDAGSWNRLLKQARNFLDAVAQKEER